MITRIEIDGFKSFHNFVVDLRPFQVLIGPNGVGKSNLFDAIVLLSNLAADNTLYEAFRRNRGEVGELFTNLPDGTRSRGIKFAVEMLIGKDVRDTLGGEEKVSSTRLRYEVHIERRNEDGFERLYVNFERLSAIIEDDDKWVKTNINNHKRRYWIVRGRRAPYISTENGFINKHQDRRAGGKQATPLGRIERTVLSTISSVEYPTAYAARQEMLNWRFLQLDPTELRKPSDFRARTELQVDGSNLAAVLYRMSREDEFALTDVSRDMTNILPGVLNIGVRSLAEREEFLIEAETVDHSKFSSRVLSDGTLRLLALVTLKWDSHHQGVLCFEEPENGVHPMRLKQIVSVLKELATDFLEEPEENDTPRQVLVNTHSPKLLSFVEVSNLLFLYMPVNQPRPTRAAPVNVMFQDENSSLIYYTIEQIKEFLDISSQNEQLEAIAAIAPNL